MWLFLSPEWPPQWMSWCPYVWFLPCPSYQQVLYCFWSRRGSASLSIFSLLVGSNLFCTGLQTLFGTWSVSAELNPTVYNNSIKPVECMAYIKCTLCLMFSLWAVKLHGSRHHGGPHLYKLPTAGLCLGKKPPCASAASLALWVMVNKTKWFH